MKFSFSIAILIAICFGCGNSSTSDKPLAAQDSIKLQNKEYEKGLVSLANEKNIEILLCQNWEMEDDLEVIRNNGNAEGIFPFRSFSLADDFTFVKNPRNFMEYGKWSYDDAAKKITLTSSNGAKDEYKIAAIGPDELVVINSGIGAVTKLKFVSGGKKNRNRNEGPYYIENNNWRIKPKAPETDTLIKKRLKEYLRFNILFYKDNLARQQKTISFYGFPTCLRWYSGGIGMAKKEALADNWYQCFYNKEQAMQAYNMMEAIVRRKYIWPKERMSWVKMNLLVLEQMYVNL